MMQRRAATRFGLLQRRCPPTRKLVGGRPGTLSVPAGRSLDWHGMGSGMCVSRSLNMRTRRPMRCVV